MQTFPHQLNGTNIGRRHAVAAKARALRSTFDRTRGPKAAWSVSVVFLVPHCAAARPAIPVPVPKSKTFFPATRCRWWPRNAARCSPCIIHVVMVDVFVYVCVMCVFSADWHVCV